MRAVLSVLRAMLIVVVVIVLGGVLVGTIFQALGILESPKQEAATGLEMLVWSIAALVVLVGAFWAFVVINWTSKHLAEAVREHRPGDFVIAVRLTNVTLSSRPVEGTDGSPSAHEFALLALVTSAAISANGKHLQIWKGGIPNPQLLATIEWVSVVRIGRAGQKVSLTIDGEHSAIERLDFRLLNERVPGWPWSRRPAQVTAVEKSLRDLSGSTA